MTNAGSQRFRAGIQKDPYCKRSLLALRQTVRLHLAVTKDSIMTHSLFRIGASVGILGIAVLIAFVVRQDFLPAAMHAHLGLLGAVTQLLSALYYYAVPAAGVSRLARYQALVCVAGAVLFRADIAGELIDGNDRVQLVMMVGADAILLGVVLFAVIVFRTGRLSSRVRTNQP
jgi:hypothetical protein